MTIKVLFSAPYMVPIVDRFREIFTSNGIDLIVPEVIERLSEDQLMAYAGEVDGVLCGDDRFSEPVLEAYAPRLKVISKWGTGIDGIDSDAAARLGVQVCNTPGAFTDPVADTVMSYLLAFARSVPWLDRAMKVGRWQKIPGRALQECTLGVVGVGNIGKAVLRRARVFGMRLFGNDIVEIDQAFLWDVGVEMVTLDQLLSLVDFVSLNCDLNPTSYHLIDREAFKKMQPHAVLINTSRGQVIEEEALIEALQQKQIAGAGLDVFEDEPLPKGHPFMSMENVLLSPHNANSSPGAWKRVHINSLRNLFRGLGLEFVVGNDISWE
ncbi:MAG: phosphoglycerate dehydrogenase [Anaerolineaceae bacterium]|nr:MAG: phosphoglycerate dehydrogenase [Anaerolineaceae bacterium]